MPRLAAQSLLAATAILLAIPSLRAQDAVPPGTGDRFKDTSPLKLPPGARVAIIEFEDLECPACSRAFPIVHAAVERYKIPLVRHDFPLPQHNWSRDAAIYARYLQDKVSPQVAEEYRRDVFSNQAAIASLDDQKAYTLHWFAAHKLQMPFSLGRDSLFGEEVEADHTLGDRIGLVHTPSIFVVYSKGWVQVTDITQLYSTLDNAIAQSPAAPSGPKGGPRKPASPQR